MVRKLKEVKRNRSFKIDRENIDKIQNKMVISKMQMQQIKGDPLPIG